MTVTDESIITLRDYVELLAKRNADAIASLSSNMAEINRIHSDAHAREHAMTKDALDNAKRAMDLRLDEMNQFRAQITDERGHFLTKVEFQRFEEGLSKEMRVMSGAWARLYGGAAAFTLVLAVLAIVGWMTR